MDAGRARGNYLFGHSEDETRRLQTQADLFNSSTQHMLEDAGIAPGMRVLDVGSGAGDVTMLLAKLVGSGGAVVGVDQNAQLVDCHRGIDGKLTKL